MSLHHLEHGPLSSADPALGPIDKLCGLLQREGRIRIVAELPGGFTGARVFMAQQQTTPTDPQPFILVFKVAKGAVLREEVERFVKLWPRARAHNAFAQILEPLLTMSVLVDDYDCAIAYEHVAAAFGRAESVSLKDVVSEALHDNARFSEAHELIQTTMRALSSLYARQEDAFAWEVARYYLERWLPHFRLAVQEAVDLESAHVLLTMHHLNPSFFVAATYTQADVAQRAAEAPDCRLPELVMPMLKVRRPVRDKLLVHERDLSLEVDVGSLPEAARKNVASLEHVSVWVPTDPKATLYERYAERLQRAFLGEDLSRPLVAIGGHWFHNPLHHLSRPLVEQTRYLTKTTVVPAHGDLHPGNVLAVGTAPVLIDYGLSDLRLPVGVDAARLFGGLVRDVFSTKLTVDELTAVLRAVLSRDADALCDMRPEATRASALLDLIQSAVLTVMGDAAAKLWPLHLYGFAFVGLKWDAEPERAHEACGILAAVALTEVLGVPSPNDLLRIRPVGALSTDIAPEAPAEILVLVAKFRGAADYDPTVRVYQALADNLFDAIPEITRVEYVDRVVLSRKDAIDLAQRYQASMVVWGTYDNFGIRPRYEVTRDSLVARQSMIQLDEATRHNLQEKFDIYITNDLGAEISFLSLKAVGDMCALNLNHSAALRVYDKALSLVSRPERLRTLGAVDVYRLKAAILFGLRRNDEAVAANAQAAELAPDDLLTRIQALSLRAAVEKRPFSHMLADLRAIVQERLNAAEDDDHRKALNAVLSTLESIKSPHDVIELAENASPVKYRTLGHNRQFAKDVAVHLNNGQDALKRDDYRTALRAFNMALRLNPNCAPAIVGRARVLALTDHVPAALEALERAERLDRNEVDIYQCRAYILIEAGEYEACLENVEKLLQLGVSRVMVLIPWGLSLIAVGRGEEMMSELKKEQLAPDDTDIFVVRAAYYRNVGQYDASLRELAEAVAIKPDFSYFFGERARVHAARQQFDLALVDARHAESLTIRGTFDRRKATQLVQEFEERVAAGRAETFPAQEAPVP